jgi:hypothetical protein
MGRVCGVLEQVWRALEYGLFEEAELREDEAELAFLPGLRPCLFVSPLAALWWRERIIGHALAVVALELVGFVGLVEGLSVLAEVAA